MQNTRWLRYGLASLTLCGAAISALVVACSSDSTDNGGTPNTGVDSGPGTDANNTTTDSGNNTDNDSGADSAPPPPPPAKLQLVNAATDLGPNDVGALRVCFQVAPAGTTDPTQFKWASLPPLPNRNSAPDQLPFPGLYIGTGGPIPGTGVDFTSLIIRPYIFSAQSLAVKSGLGNNITAGHDQFCEDILTADAGGPLTNGTDYWQLPDIPAGNLLANNSYILALTGCSGNSTAGDICGSDFSAATVNGNLRINLFKVDTTTTVDTASLGAQFLQLSPTLEAVLTQVSEGQVTKAFPAVTDSEGANAKYLVGDGGAGTGAVSYMGTQGLSGVATTLAQITQITYASDKFTANPAAPTLGATFPQVQALSNGVTDAGVPLPPAVANGSAYTFIALGDPSPATSPDGGSNGAVFNTRYFHYIALPNSPTISAFDPTK